MKAKRKYKRLESFYNVSRMNGVYSVTMIDIVLVALPVLVIIHDVGTLGSYNDRMTYISILLSMFTIGFNFISHLFAIISHNIDNAWAEEEMNVLNGTVKVNSIGDSDTYNRIGLGFSCLSYIFLCGVAVSFYMTL